MSVSHVQTCTLRFNTFSHLGNLCSLLQEAFHFFLPMDNIHGRATGETHAGRRRERKRKRREKHEGTEDEERRANRRTYKLQMIVQNTHYLSIASLLPQGTRSGNSQNEERERVTAKNSYLGRKALQALENEFRTSSLKKQQIQASFVVVVVFDFSWVIILFEMKGLKETGRGKAEGFSEIFIPLFSAAQRQTYVQPPKEYRPSI